MDVYPGILVEPLAAFELLARHLEAEDLLLVEVQGGADTVRVHGPSGLERALTSSSAEHDAWSDFLPVGTYRVEVRRGDARATTEVVLSGERNLAVTLALD